MRHDEIKVVRGFGEAERNGVAEAGPGLAGEDDFQKGFCGPFDQERNLGSQMAGGGKLMDECSDRPIHRLMGRQIDGGF